VTNSLSRVAKQQFFDDNGRPAVGYKLFTYAAGTSTKLATYQGPTTGSPNANPIELDFRGQADIWTPPNVSYKYVFARPSDTDPPGAPVWSVDNVLDSQLVTLYGGVDTGITNAYVLTFVANFSAYADGIVIYWLPANTNNSASTINVNGLGPVNILNEDGTSLSRGQITANSFSQIIYQGTGFKLITPRTQVFFAGTSTGVVNSYLLTVPLFALRQGTLVYFAPNISNDGLADVQLSINGNFSAVRNIDGSLLRAGQLTASQIAGVVVDSSGTFILVSSPISTGTFTGTLTGMTGSVTRSIKYVISGNLVSLSFELPTGDATGTSNTTAMKMTGLPNVINPSGRISTAFCGYVIDNGSILSAQAQVLNNEILLFLGFDGGTLFTAAGTKGLNRNWCLTYQLS
jgi:hypothetical protein